MYIGSEFDANDRLYIYPDMISWHTQYSPTDFRGQMLVTLIKKQGIEYYEGYDKTLTKKKVKHVKKNICNNKLHLTIYTKD